MEKALLYCIGLCLLVGIIGCVTEKIVVDPIDDMGNFAPLIQQLPDSIRLAVIDRHQRETVFEITFKKKWCYEITRISGKADLSNAEIHNEICGLKRKIEGFPEPPEEKGKENEKPDKVFTWVACFDVDENKTFALVKITIKAGWGSATGYIRGPCCKPHDQGGTVG